MEKTPVQKPVPTTVFAPGRYGNPRGREPGSKNKLTLLREQLATPELLKFTVEATVTAAKNGDVGALKLLLERLWDVPRATLPGAEPIAGGAGTLAERGQAVIDAALASKIPADVAALMLQSLQGQARLVESEDLQARIEALERSFAANTSSPN